MVCGCFRADKRDYKRTAVHGVECGELRDMIAVASVLQDKMGTHACRLKTDRKYWFVSTDVKRQNK